MAYIHSFILLYRIIFINSPDIDTKDIDRCLIVRQISKIYDFLCDIVEAINFCFSFQVNCKNKFKLIEQFVPVGLHF